MFCVFNATPLEKYENYRLCLDRWRREESDAPDLGPTLYNLIDGLVRFLGINQYSPHNTTQPRLLVDLMPEVYFRSSDGLLRRLLSRKGVSEEEREAMLQRVEDRGCAYLPQVNAFYMHDFQMVHASEEATRFLHHACRGLPVRVTAREEAADEPADFFYARVLENTLAYFGSRVLYPARAAVRETDLRDLSEQTREDVERQTGLGFAESMRALDFLLLHRLLEVDVKQCERVRGSLDEGIRSSGPRFEYITRQLGYLLGCDLYDGYLEGRVTPGFVPDCFLHTWKSGNGTGGIFHAGAPAARAAAEAAQSGNREEQSVACTQCPALAFSRATICFRHSFSAEQSCPRSTHFAGASGIMACSSRRSGPHHVRLAGIRVLIAGVVEGLAGGTEDHEVGTGNNPMVVGSLSGGIGIGIAGADITGQHV